MNRLPARLGVAALLLSSVCFLLYPAIRPFSDETSLQGAAAFASSAWVTAHVLAMIAFICLVSGMLGVLLALAGLPAARRAFWTMQVMTVGVGLTLPFYGAETFGLRVIGQEAIQQNSAALVRLALLIRSGPGLVMFGAGLLLLAASGIMVAVLLWRSGGFPRWSGVPLGLGLALYLPQFFGSQAVRVAHGLLMCAGSAWVALALWRQPERGDGPARRAHRDSSAAPPR